MDQRAAPDVACALRQASASTVEMRPSATTGSAVIRVGHRRRQSERSTSTGDLRSMWDGSYGCVRFRVLAANCICAHAWGTKGHGCINDFCAGWRVLDQGINGFTLAGPWAVAAHTLQERWHKLSMWRRHETSFPLFLIYGVLLPVWILPKAIIMSCIAASLDELCILGIRAGSLLPLHCHLTPNQEAPIVLRPRDAVDCPV